jgi:signal transduction histidine kinase
MIYCMHARRIAPWVAVGLTVAGLGFAVTLEALASNLGADALTVVGWCAATLASGAVGFLLATRCGDNPVGWLLLANGLVLTASAVAITYSEYAVLAEPGALPGGEWAVLYAERAWPLLFVCPIAIAFLFPDGRLPSPAWRPVAIATAASFGVLIVLSLLAAERYSDEFAHVSSPLPQLSESVIGIPFLLSGLGALGGLVAGALAIRTRLRRASGVERYQLKWLAYAATLIPATVIVCLAEIAITGEEGTAVTVALVVTMTAIAAAIGVAITRYRLYEIDGLVSHTLTYAVLTAGLAATFAAVSLSLGVAIGSGSTLPTAAATLAVALAFGPLRRRVQRLVDRRFDRARYEGLGKVERFLDELRGGRAAPEGIGDVLAQALGDPSLELFFWLPGEKLHVDAAGRVVDESRLAGGACTPVRRGALRLATVVHDESLGDRPGLLQNVIEAAGLAIEIARLRVEVRRRLAEVEESRARIVTAGYEERRRLERDLHDGAQQRLVSIGLALRHVQAQLPTPSRPSAELNGVVAEVSDAIEELRELARGVRPAGLDDGLSPALRELASRSPLPIRVDATEERFEDRLETAAYFVASEALANAAKHARASEVSVSAGRLNGSLVLCVRDDGSGGALPAAGSGLAGISDRVAALGGTLTVESPPGRGTVVTAELPCES